MRSRTVAHVAAAVLLVGCSSAADGDAATEAPEPRILQPGAPGEESRELTAEEIDDLARVDEPTPADVAFMQGMIVHHVQALQMARLVPDRTARDDVPLFAERIDVSQEDEIDLMRAWLEGYDEEVPSLLPGHDHGDEHDMAGMLAPAQMAELEAADGEEFDRLFLESMIVHHLGAVAMVESLFSEGGGASPAIARFANDVAADQGIEINRAQAMLADMEAAD